MNFVNYLRHSFHEPEIYHREFSHDLPSEESVQNHSWASIGRRIALSSLPFISLYKPAGFVLSTTMGSARVISHLGEAICAERKGKWKEVGSSLALGALAVGALAGMIFNFTIGTLLSTLFDTGQSLFFFLACAYRGDYAHAFEQMMQAGGSALYLAFMMTGALELMLAFILFQVITSLVNAREDYSKGRYIEMGAKLLMGSIRGYQAYGQVQLIQKRNAFLRLEKFRAIFARALKGRATAHLISNPLAGDINGKIDEKRVTLSDMDGKEYDLGSHFHGFGKALVKGENITLRHRVIEEEEITELDFRVNRVFREKIQETIQQMQNLSGEETKEFLSLAGSHVRDIQVETATFPLGESLFGGSAHKISLEGMGEVYIGASRDEINIHDRVIVRLSSEKTLFDLHEMVSFLNLEEALQLSTPEDIERLKMGHLFRTFCPSEAYPLERDESFFELPLDELKNKIIASAPQMEEIFATYFDRMTPGEILPGEVRYRINGLADKVHAEGGRALTAAILGTSLNEGYFERVASMVKMGLLSSEVRAASGIGYSGLNSEFDFFVGGGDGVFTQIVSERDCKEGRDIGEMAYYSRIRLVFSLDALEMGTYQYPSDQFGHRDLDEDWRTDYRKRSNIVDLAHAMQNEEKGDFAEYWPWASDYFGNEVISKKRIPPSFFKAVVVPDDKTYQDLLQYLRNKNVVEVIDGQETILGQAADRFIRVATKWSEDLVS